MRSLGFQRHQLKTVVHNHGWHLVREFTDLSPCVNTHRPGLQDVIVQARAGRFDILVVRTIDRLARPPRILLQVLDTLQEAGVAHVAAAETEVSRCPGR